MKRHVIVLFAIATVASTYAVSALAAKKEKPADRVVVIYFHRTQRCPTCLKMGSYTEQAVKKAFAKQLKEGVVEFFLVDYQAKKNVALAKAYKVAEPALIIAKVKSNKVKEYKNLKDIWVKVREKSQFMKYVCDNVDAYLARGLRLQDGRL